MSIPHRQGAIEKDYLGDAFIMQVKIPEHKLWWAALVSGVRDAIKETQGRATVSKRPGQATAWIFSDKKTIGSVEWITLELNITFLPYVRKVIRNKDQVAMNKLLQRIN